MRTKLKIALTSFTLTSAAYAAPQEPSSQLPRIIGGKELEALVRGATISRLPPDYQSSLEIFRPDGSYVDTDGAKEFGAGTYYFTGNRFCIREGDRKPDHCRSVLIDKSNRTWLITEGEKLGLDLVRFRRP